MRGLGIGICDRDREYAYGVMQYMNRRRDLMVQCCAFTGMEAVRAAIREKHLDLILTGDLSQTEACEEGYFLDRVPCLFLSPLPEPGRGAVFKYQSLPALVHEVMRFLLKNPYPDDRECRFAVVFSPVGRCGKTRFAKAYATAAGGLYVGMEDFSGGSGTELLYLLKNGMTGPERLGELIRKEEGYSALLSSGVQFDIRCLSREDIEHLNEQLREVGSYGRVVYDLGAAAPEMPAILSLFDVIYMPVLEDPVSMAKKEQFCRVLRDMGLTDVLLKLRELRLPDSDEHGEEMKRAAKEALEEEAGLGGQEGKMEEDLSRPAGSFG